MSDEAAVLDAPTDISAIDISTDSTAIDTSTADNATTDQVDSSDTPAAGETGHLRGAELYRAVKDKLKSSGLTPAEQRSLRNAIHIAAKADEFTGGDLTKFEAERQTYSQLARDGEESLTPEDLVATVRADREQLAGILADIESGAPKMIEELVSDHPEAFKSLVPQAMDRLSELDNERFSNYVARSAVSYLQSKGMDVQFAMIDAFLPSIPAFPGKDQLVSALQSVYKTVSGLKTIAAKEIPSTAKPNSTQFNANPDQPSTLDQREMNITRQEWNQTAAQPNVNLRDTEMTRTAQTRKVTLTDQEKSDIKSAVREEFESRLAANQRYGQEMQRFLKSGNKREYERRAKAEGEKLLPSIVARHANAVIDKRSQAKPITANGTTKPAAQTTPAKDASGNLFQWISGPPKSLGLQVDHNRQRPGMMARGEAYVIGQKSIHKWKVKSAMLN